MALQDLQHPYICGYKEFFVTWDKQVKLNNMIQLYNNKINIILNIVYFVFRNQQCVYALLWNIIS
jgi:hypothetical protein